MGYTLYMELSEQKEYKMSLLNQIHLANAGSADFNEKSFYKIGGVAALMQFIVTLAIILVSFTLGAKPDSAQEYFTILQNDRLAGLLRDDFSSLIVIALYLGLFPALYLALRRLNQAYVAFVTALIFIGVTNGFAAHSGFSMIYLGDRYAAATSAAQRAQLLAAGEAVIASDLWNSSAGYMTGILQGAGVLISAIMLRSQAFSKATAYAGLLGNGFDLAQHILHPFAPSVSAPLMMIMGPFYLAWFPLLARDLFRLGRGMTSH
jgi:uncharacterized membrane protein YciS (DUF1049 family)